eukprot:2191361-Rhodomonas_salina.1
MLVLIWGYAATMLVLIWVYAATSFFILLLLGTDKVTQEPWATELGWRLVLGLGALPCLRMVPSAVLSCYAKCGTELAYGATPSAVLSWCMVLPGSAERAGERA